jgi:Na+/H+ antiporter NhaA|tara:strand:+ start:915 stop:1100 length:186 start_codon:yes stop_codon:yes gene_type:complete
MMRLKNFINKEAYGGLLLIFISELAFKVEEHKQIEKVGVITTLFISATIGMIWLRRRSKKL